VATFHYRSLIRLLIGASLFATSDFAQSFPASPSLRLKTREIQTADPKDDPVEGVAPQSFGRGGHMLLQFNQLPTADTIAELENRGIRVLQTVPENGLLVTVEGRVHLQGLQVRYAAPIVPSDKISPLIVASDSATSGPFYLAEFHPDVNMNYARTLLLNLGLELRENSYLHPRHLMVLVRDPKKLSEIAGLDEAAYIFPASDQLAAVTPVRACAGAIVSARTATSSLSQITAAGGPGWSSKGLNGGSLNYVFGHDAPAGSAQLEVQRAMAEWSKVIKLDWVQATNPVAARTVNILFGSADHGDGPFEGPYGVLVHTFYPSPQNPEPIAGDIYFNDDEMSRIGTNTDAFSVALHELGHALGLGHSDNPFDVMYPYYRVVGTLAAGDTAAIQTMYAAQEGSNGGMATPLTMRVVVPQASGADGASTGGGPTADSVLPDAGTGSTQDFTFRFSDSEDPLKLIGFAMLFSTSITTQNSCYIVVDRNSATVTLRWDSGIGADSKPIASATVLQNSQCLVGAVSASISGLSEIITASVTFKPAFSGLKNIYMFGSEGAVNTGWVLRERSTRQRAQGQRPIR